MAKLPPEALDFFKREGKKGGKRAAESMTAAERRERAQKAAAKSAAVRSKNASVKKKSTKNSKTRSEPQA